MSMANESIYEAILQEKYFQMAMGNTICTIIGALIGLMGNIFVIFVYFFRIKNRGERYFIPLLATVDFLACLMNPPFYVMDNTYFYNYPSSILCRILSFFHVCVAAISAYILFFISLQRYLLVCKPHIPKMTLCWKRFSFISSCIFGFISTAPILGTAGVLESTEMHLNNNISIKTCKFSVHQTPMVSIYFAFLMILSTVNVIVTFFLYVPVLLKMKHHARKISSSRNTQRTQQSQSEDSFNSKIKTISDKSEADFSHENCSTERSNVETSIANHQKKYSRRRLRAKERFNMMFFIIILTYVLSYIPPLVLLVLTYTIHDFNYIKLTDAELVVWIYLSRLVFINHIVNPFIYGYFDTKFKDNLKNFLKTFNK